MSICDCVKSFIIGNIYTEKKTPVPHTLKLPQYSTKSIIGVE